MKLIICPFCKANAVGRKSELFPSGEPLFVGSVPTKGFISRCGRCKRAFKIASTDRKLLKDVGVDELVQLGFPPELLTQDGGSLPPATRG